LLRLLTAAFGTKLLNARALVCPEELAKADMRPFRRDLAFDPNRKWSVHRSSRGCLPDQLLDHLIGAQHEPSRDFMSDRRRGLEIDDQLELGRLLDR
jgi:hypothetical protein